MNDEDVKLRAGASSATTAVSLFGDPAAAGDFPVLKAFQEYIDAEQAKARKRMLGLSVFFVVLLVVVVITFVLVLTFMIRQNQSLSDRLLDMAFKQQPAVQQPVAPQPAVQQPVAQQPTPTVQPAPQQDSLLKPLLEKMEKIATAMADASDKAKSAPPQQPVAQVQQAQPAVQVQPVQPAATVAPAAVPAVLQTEEARIREQLRIQREELIKMREQAKAEKERLRQEEVERHRRKLYPEHYAREDARKAAEKRRAEVPPVSYFDTASNDDDDIAEIERLAREARAKEAAAKKAAEATEAAARRKAQATEADAQRRAKATEDAAKKRAAEIEASAKKKAAATEAAAKKRIEDEAAAKRKADAEERRRAEERAAKTRVEKIEIDTKDSGSLPLLIPPVE